MGANRKTVRFQSESQAGKQRRVAHALYHLAAETIAAQRQIIYFEGKRLRYLYLEIYVKFLYVSLFCRAREQLNVELILNV